MKTLFLILTATILMNLCAAQNNYEQTMSNAIEKLNQSTSINGFIETANTFERISKMEQNDWLPLYYAAYSYILVSYEEQDLDKKDPYLDKAQQFIDKAFKIAPKESELFALQAFLYPSRMTVDPMGRGMEYMGIMNKALEDAIQQNPENPRSYFLKGVITLNLPENFGGGATIAKPIFEKAKVKFDKFQPKTAISPNWGKEQNEVELSKI